jgi:hypothetical protein
MFECRRTLFARRKAGAETGTFAFVLACALAATAAPMRSSAQQSSPPALQGIQVLATPYLWLPWTSVNVHPNSSRIQSQSNTIDPGQMITHLTWVPFMGVVAAFKDLLECFRCSKCESWLHVTPRVQPETLRCTCNENSFNLKGKPKQAA